MGASTLLDGRQPQHPRTETLASHLARYGPLGGNPDLVELIDTACLTGRGGAAFPVGRKWRSVASRARGDARLLVNGAEGDPLSAKDVTLMSSQPHLVIDGAQLAATAVGASEITLYVGARHHAALRALRHAIGERAARRLGGRRMRVVAAPDAYVAGEESAAVHFVNDGDARPTTTPPRPFERGIAGRPTLIHNVETLARVAQIARAPNLAAASEIAGQTLVTVSSPAGRRVAEVGPDVSVGDLAPLVGADFAGTHAVLVGGYFGRWTTPITAWSLPVDTSAMRAAGLALGAGMISFIGPDECGVGLTARMVDYLAGQSAAQCGPCVYGLAAVAGTLRAIGARRASGGDLARLERWRGQLTGRGACHHPDGTAALLGSALTVFADEFDQHVRRRRCTARVAGAVA